MRHSKTNPAFRRRRFFPRDLAAAVLWALLLLGLSSVPGDQFPAPPPVIGFDKLVHLTLYGVLGWLVWRALGPRGVSAWIVWLLCVVYGAGDELYQHTVPGRFPSWWDLAADAGGAGLAVLAAVHWQKRRDGEEGRRHHTTSD